jgi:hypothetical protein
VDEILAEQDPSIALPELRESPQGLPPGDSGALIHGRHDTARTRLHHAERDLADTNADPVVFLEAGLAIHDQVRTKPIHRNRRVEARVEIGQGGLTGEQERIAVGEPHPVPGPAVPPIDRTLDLLRHEHQACLPAQEPQKPVAGVAVGMHAFRHITPDVDPRAPAPGRRPIDRKIGTPRCAQPDAPAGPSNRKRCQGGAVPLRDHLAVRPENGPSTVALDPHPAEPGLR